MQELISLIHKNLDDFDTYVSSKGFQYQETIDDEYTNSVTYAHNQSKYSKKAEKFITLHTRYISQGRRNVTFQTFDLTDYLKIKKQIKEKGFKFIKTESYEGTTFLEYTQSQYELSLGLIQKKDENGKFVTSYEISLTFSSN